MKVMVVVPTYNERENITPLAECLLSLGISGLTVLIVDDNSPDGTGHVADALAERFPGAVQVQHRPAKQGIGRAYVDGLTCALDSGADYVIQMDADFSHPPSTIPAMLEAIQECDVVVGSRYVAGGRLDEQWGGWRRFLSWWANEVWSRRILQLKAKDITSGFRCWRRATLLGIGLDTVRSDGYAFLVELTYLSERLGYRVMELPIFFQERRIGASKMSAHSKLQAAQDVIRMRLRHRRPARQNLAIVKG